MTGRMSRNKGKVGEREVVHLARDCGFPEAERDWRTPQLDGDLRNIGPTHLEVRRREKLCIPQWSAEIEEQARNGNLPILAFRRSGEPWRAALRLDSLFRLLSGEPAA